MKSNIEILKREVESAGIKDTIGQNAYRLSAPGLNGDTSFVGLFVSISKLQTLSNDEVHEQVVGLGRRLYVVTDLDYDDTMVISAIEISGAHEVSGVCTRSVSDFISDNYKEIDEPIWFGLGGRVSSECVCIRKVCLRGDFDNLIENDWAFQEIIDELVA